MTPRGRPGELAEPLLAAEAEALAELVPVPRHAAELWHVSVRALARCVVRGLCRRTAEGGYEITTKGVASLRRYRVMNPQV